MFEYYNGIKIHFKGTAEELAISGKLLHPWLKAGAPGDFQAINGETLAEGLLRSAREELTLTIQTLIAPENGAADELMTLRFLRSKFKSEERLKVIYPWLLAFRSDRPNDDDVRKAFEDLEARIGALSPADADLNNLIPSEERLIPAFERAVQRDAEASDSADASQDWQDRGWTPPEA